ncbi:TPA: DnaD domain protein [Streptococcus agalactiae]|nr:DnaD domain protein [Streptococcus agalactiae]
MSNSCPTEKEIEKEKESKKEKEKEIEIEIESKQKKEIYIDNFDATTDFTKIRNIEDFLGDNYLTDLTDEDLITGFTQYYLARVPDNYELNTLKKRLKTIDRELLQQAYKQAGMNGANTLAYIVATLKNWEKLGIKDLEDWENHEKEREALTEDEMLPF